MLQGDEPPAEAHAQNLQSRYKLDVLSTLSPKFIMIQQCRHLSDWSTASHNRRIRRLFLPDRRVHGKPAVPLLFLFVRFRSCGQGGGDIPSVRSPTRRAPGGTVSGAATAAVGTTSQTMQSVVPGVDVPTTSLGSPNTGAAINTTVYT